jgi:hypothetical protein
MAFTFAPFNNIDIPDGNTVQFGDGFEFRRTPAWLASAEMLKRMSFIDQQYIADARCVLISEYDASAIGAPDPNSDPSHPQSIQERKSSFIILGNLAMWLAQPSRACFSVVCHGPHMDTLEGQPKQPIVQQVERQNPMHCHPDDVNKRLSVDQIIDAGRLHGVLVLIPRKDVVWQAMRMFWAALASYQADVRYSLFWIGLEALFGPDGNTGEITYKLAQRAAFFISNSAQEARDVFTKAKKCYALRSKIAHGRWQYDPSIDAAMADTEMIARASCRRLLTEPEMLKTFTSKKRDQFLEDWVFSRATDPPPFP